MLNSQFPILNSHPSKLIVFAGLEAGPRTEFCAAGVAVRLARKRRRLAFELGSEAGILGKYLPLQTESSVQLVTPQSCEK